jgi:hypothetical protein
MTDRLRELFAVPPAEFVAARDALAKELRASRREDEAKEVASLRRPTAPVWAVNQLARRAPSDVEELLDSSERVEKAQLRGAAGDELRAAMSAQRAALAKLERGAEQILRGAGLQSSPAALRTMQSTLQAAATGAREMRERLRSGTLLEELEPAGFEVLLGAGIAGGHGHEPATKTATSTSSRRDAAAASRAAKAEARQAKLRAEQQAREERKRARETAQLEARLRKLEAQAEAAERAAKKAREAVDSARADLQRLRG